MSENEKLVERLTRALRLAEDGAGTLPAKEAVKLRPADWHAVTKHAREAAAALTAAEARIKALEEALEPFAKAAPPRVIPDMHAMLFEGLGENCKAVLVARDFRQALSTLEGNADDR